jgi:ubiquinone/menaquinone biosynthesis C-methylase UbiE
MVNIKEYDKIEDFFHHQNEFNKCLNIINKYCGLENKLVLDLCSGTGLHIGFLVNTNCKYVIGIDLLDYGMFWGKDCKLKLLKSYNQFGVNFDKNKCQVITMNAEVLSFKDDLFDFVFCLNAFEHISDPPKALYEIWRVLKPEGFAFVQFDPIYFCDTRSHMFDFLPEPWVHLMCSEEEYVSKLINAGTPDDIINDFRYCLNKKPKDYFFDLFEKVLEYGLFEKKESYRWSGVVKKVIKNIQTFLN